jgi:hypothetical protein
MATADIAYTFYLMLAKILGPGLTYGELHPKYVLYVTTKCVEIHTTVMGSTIKYSA